MCLQFFWRPPHWLFMRVIRIIFLFLFINAKNRKRKGKLVLKNEEISERKAHTNTWKLNWNILTITDVFLDEKRVNVCENMVKMAPHESEKLLDGTFFTVCSQTFILFWLRKTSVIVNMFQLSFCVCVCVPFIWRSLHFLVRVSPFFSYFWLSALWYSFPCGLFIY